MTITESQYVRIILYLGLAAAELKGEGISANILKLIIELNVEARGQKKKDESM